MCIRDRWNPIDLKKILLSVIETMKKRAPDSQTQVLQKIRPRLSIMCTTTLSLLYLTCPFQAYLFVLSSFCLREQQNLSGRRRASASFSCVIWRPCWQKRLLLKISIAFVWVPLPPNMDTSKSLTFPSLNSEADSEIASLAAAWDCAVLSNDSDFFIFDIKGGYIPLSFLRWKSGPLKAKIYYRSKLASHFRIRSNLLPCLLYTSPSPRDA